MGPRVRVLLSAVLSLLAVAALAVPLALTLADRRSSELRAERVRQLDALTDAAAVPNAPLQRLVDRYHDVYGENLLIVDSDGQALAARGLDVTQSDVADAVHQALVDAPAPRMPTIRPWDRAPVLTAAGVRRDGELVGAVVLAVDPTTAAADIARGWGVIAIGSVGLLGLVVLLASGLTRWVMRPITGLERAVAAMTEGVAGPPAHVSGPPELRHFTTAFNTMSQVVRASLDRQRRLIGDTSHQLRNPLAAVRLRADMLEDHVVEEGRPTYQSMSDELDRFENLLRQLLRLARAEQLSGSRQVGLEATAADSTDVDDVARERVSFWQPVAEQNRHRLIVAPDGHRLAVQLPRHDLEQLLDVAIDNALHYTGPDTTITVSAEAVGDVVDVIVSDDGSGLRDEDLARATARFWRGDDDGGGTGLGLAIATEIAAGHGGTIQLEHAPEGGLLVRYRLPAAQVLPC